jgi:hypothetical protein
VVHYPAGIAGGCHPGVADTCPIAECVQKRERAAALQAATEAQFDQLAASVRAMQARHDAQVTAAAYRAAAAEISNAQDAIDTAALADHDELYDTEQHTSRAIRLAADRLRARADQMGQQ